MQIQSLRIKSYRSFRIDDTTPAEAFERLRKIETYRELRAEGCGEAAALRAIGWSRAAYFRWQARYRAGGVKGLAAQSRRPRRTNPKRWTRTQEWAVWRMRKKYPFLGKKRLRVMLAREAVALSESTLGRILSKGVRLGRIRPCAFCRGRVQAKKRRDFQRGHAQRWQYGSKATRPGELLQIDHRSVSRDGDTLKEFKAACPYAKQRAARFLQAVRDDLPFPLRSSQSLPPRSLSPRRRGAGVDGGSEFQAEFEDACQTLNLPLHVLPPKSPQFNGVVERANDRARVEFWNLYQGPLTVKDAGPALAEYQRFYNPVRPHYALDWMTPMESLLQNRPAESGQSHMS